jgi:ABC-type sugar transport system permease subunit
MVDHSTAPARRRPRGRLPWAGNEAPEWLTAYAYALPAVGLTIVLFAYPLAHSLWMSLHSVDLAGQLQGFVGLDNYATVIGDDLFLPSLWRTVRFALAIIVGTVLLSITFAMSLNDPFPGRAALRSIMILPWSVSQVMLALTFGWIFNSTYGPLNGLLLEWGLAADYRSWFADGTTVLNILSFAVAWNLVPFATLLFTGALQSVPEDLHKAARIDGAGAIARFLHVTLPAIKDTVLVVIVLATLNAFLTFAPIMILTGGGPGSETTLLSWWGYEVGFRDFRLGEAAAIFYLMTLILAAIAVVTIIILGRRPQDAQT